MADEDALLPQPDPRPVKVVWDLGGVRVFAPQYLPNGREVGNLDRVVELNDPRLTANQRTQLLGVMRAVARLYGDIQ